MRFPKTVNPPYQHTTRCFAAASHKFSSPATIKEKTSPPSERDLGMGPGPGSGTPVTFGTRNPFWSLPVQQAQEFSSLSTPQLSSLPFLPPSEFSPRVTGGWGTRGPALSRELLAVPPRAYTQLNMERCFKCHRFSSVINFQALPISASHETDTHSILIPFSLTTLA